MKHCYNLTAYSSHKFKPLSHAGEFHIIEFFPVRKKKNTQRKETFFVLHTFQLEDNHLDKKTFVTIQDGQYIMNRIVSQGDVSKYENCILWLDLSVIIDEFSGEIAGGFGWDTFFIYLFYPLWGTETFLH